MNASPSRYTTVAPQGREIWTASVRETAPWGSGVLAMLVIALAGLVDGFTAGSCLSAEPYPAELYSAELYPAELYPAELYPAELYPTGTPEFDPYAMPTSHSQTPTDLLVSEPGWCFDVLPDGLIYRPYLAGPKESRTGIQFVSSDNDWTIDTSIGGQWGLLRYGTQDPSFPKGIQFDVEASAQFRHRRRSPFDILTGDIRFGLPLSFSRNNHQTKLALYFIRSHPSGRLLERIRALFQDDFFERKSVVLGHSIYATKRFRLYGEVGYAFSSVVSDKWEFQFGTEYAPVCPTGILGAPFIAANGYLREEVDFGGTFTLQAGWAWRKKRGRLCRIGLHYANGKSNQFALHDRHEQQVGFGFWHDY